MEFSFKELKKKTVVNLENGKKLGKISDITVSYPQMCFKSLSVTEGLFCQQEVKINVCDIEKIGEDTILVGKTCQKPKGKGENGQVSRETLEETDE